MAFFLKAKKSRNNSKIYHKGLGEIVEQSHNGILSKKNERSSDPCNNIDESQKYYSKQKKPDTNQ